MSTVFFISDFPQGEDGAEKNDRCLANELRKKDNMVHFVRSEEANVHYLTKNHDCKFIVSNFTWLSEFNRRCLMDGEDYIIYEHDHKYCRSRNPGDYEDCKVPEQDLINQDFYKNANAVFCQSKLHKEIVQKNLSFLNDSQIVNVGGNFWREDDLELMKEIRGSNKVDMCSIMRSDILHKGMRQAIKYCKQQDLEYTLIHGMDYHSFLGCLGGYKYFVFLPQTIETLSRVIVEAKMMGVKIITHPIESNRIGALSEDWILHEPREVMQHMIELKDRVSGKVLEVLNV